MKADKQATAARKLKDPRSYITPKGDEVLYGKDWDERRFELLQRSRGQCEFWYDAKDEYAHRCSRDAADPHHKTLRSVRRDDRLPNLLAVCRPHHEQLDREQRKQKGKNKIGFNIEASA